MPKLKAIVFDLDGTLVDSLGQTIKLVQKAVVGHGATLPTEDEVVKFFGLTEEGIFASLFGPEKGALICQKYIDLFKTSVDQVQAFQGILELISLLTENKISVSLYTARGCSTTTLILDHHGLHRYFDHVVTGSDVKNPKPHGEGLEKIANLYGYQTHEMMYVGDSYKDIVMAQSIKSLDGVAGWCPQLQKEKVTATNPTHHFHTVDDFKKFLVREKLIL